MWSLLFGKAKLPTCSKVTLLNIFVFWFSPLSDKANLPGCALFLQYYKNLWDVAMSQSQATIPFRMCSCIYHVLLPPLCIFLFSFTSKTTYSHIVLTALYSYSFKKLVGWTFFLRFNCLRYPHKVFPEAWKPLENSLSRGSLTEIIGKNPDRGYFVQICHKCK